MTTPPPPSPHSSSQLQIDLEISYLERKILTLKSTRNTLSPVSCLHDEVMQEIFLFVRESTKGYQKGRKSTTGNGLEGKAALLVTWVSRSWRDLAVNTPRLWSHIDFTRAEWMMKTIERAKGCELEYSFRFDTRRTYHWEALLPLSLGNLSRTKILKIQSASSVRNSAFPKSLPHWSTPTTSLVELHLENIALPPNLFSGTCPSLRSLNLNGCEADWDTLPPCPNLKSLDISIPDSKFNMGNLLAFLRGSRDTLESLSLTYSNARPPLTHTSTHAGRLQLTKLKTIHLQERNTTIVSVIFNHLRIPRDTKVVVYVEGRGEGLPDAILSSRGIKSWEIRSMKMGWDEDEETWLALRILEPRSDKEDREMGVDAPIETHILTGSEDVPPNWLTHFGSLETLHDLSISPPLMDLFFDSLKDQDSRITSLRTTSPDQDQTNLIRPIISFQNLRVLELRGGSISSEDGDGGGDEVNIKVDDFVVLKNWLGWRHLVGLKLEKLVLRGLVIHRDMSVLKEVVGELEIKDVPWVG